MANKKFTKRALFGSVIALILCCAMLVGTTFAWFTDSASSGINKIESGNLDIVLQHARFNDGYNLTEYENVTTDTKLFLNNKGEDILWEPGASGVEYFKVKNEGNLALQFKFNLIAENATKTADGHSLLEVLAGYGILRNVSVEGDRFNNLIDSRIPDPEDTTFDVLTGEGFEYETYLLPGEEITFEVGVFWEPTDHDNDYNVKGGLFLDLGIELVATQYTHEYDSYNNQYDKDAEYPEIEAPATSEPDESQPDESQPEENPVPGNKIDANWAGEKDEDGWAVVKNANLTEKVTIRDMNVAFYDSTVNGLYLDAGNGSTYVYLKNVNLTDKISAAAPYRYEVWFDNVSYNGVLLTSADDAENCFGSGDLNVGLFK